MKYGIGDIIEFQGVRERDGKVTVEEETYVDRINEICAYDDGRVGYWTQIYPELMGHRSEIREEEVTRLIESVSKYPTVPEFPFRKGQYIEFDWDGKAPNSKIRKKAVIEEIHWILGDGEPSLRISAGDAYICYEDDHKIEVIGELRPQRSGAEGDGRNSEPHAHQDA